MNSLEYLGLALFAVLIIVTLLLTRRIYLGILLWSWAWVIQLLTGIAINTSSIGIVISSAMATFFPFFLLAGLLLFLYLPVPVWLGLSALALILLKVLLIAIGLPGVSAVLTSLTEVSLLAVCSYLAASRVKEKWLRLGLTAGFVMLLTLEVFDAIIEWLSGGAFFEWWLWVLVSVPCAAFQLFAWIERSRKSMESAERDGIATRAAEDRFNALVSKSRDVITEIGSDGRIAYVSPNSKGCLGFAPEELIGISLKELVEKVKPVADMHNSMPSFAGNLSSIVAEGPFGRNYQITNPDGTDRWVEITASRYFTREGHLRAISITRDITERRKLELEVMRTQKLDSLGMLAAGVAHDFNNLLVNVLGNAELASIELDSGDKEQINGRLKSLKDSVLQAKALTQQLLVYAGKGTMEPTVIDVTAELSSLSELIKATLGDPITLDMILAEDLQPVEIETSQLQQIILNLVANARDACPVGGRVSIETTAEETLPSSAIIPGESAGPYVCITVTDTGTGIPVEAVRSIFDPFFTTKFDGRGLGLAAVFGILRMINGAIEVQSSSGKGCSFRIFLPSTTRAVEKTAGSQSKNKLALTASAMPVLAVDDSELPRQMLVDALARVDRDVITADGGEQALEILAAGKKVGTILLDLAMPGLSGSSLIARLREYVPEANIIVMSGYNAAIAADKLAGTSVAAFLQKPFRLNELYDTINAVEAGQKTND